MKIKPLLSICIVCVLFACPISSPAIASSIDNMLMTELSEDMQPIQNSIIKNDFASVVEAILISEPIPFEQYIQTKNSTAFIEEAPDFGLEIVEFSITSSSSSSESVAEMETNSEETDVSLPEGNASSSPDASLMSVGSCDLYVQNLVLNNGIQPLSMNTNYTFTFEIGNSWSSAAQNVQYAVYIDNLQAGILYVGTIPAHSYGTLSFSFGIPNGNFGGMRNLRIVAFCATPELSLNNNETGRSFLWQERVDLNVSSISNLTSGTNPFETFVNQLFMVPIVNWGSKTSTSQQVIVYINNNSIASFEVPVSLQPGYVVEFSWWIEFASSGSGANQVRADASPKYDVDQNFADNSKALVCQIIPDGCGRWIQKLSASVRGNISISVTDPRIAASSVQVAASEWNGIKSGLHISTVGSNLANPTCKVFALVLSPDKGAQFIPNTWLGDFTGGDIQINDLYRGNDPAYDKHVLVHEIGHLVGLGHPHEIGNGMGGNPRCLDAAVMQYDVNGIGIRTNYVTQHDRRAILKQYP